MNNDYLDINDVNINGKNATSLPAETPRRRGRPARNSGENKDKRFNLIMRQSTLSELNRIAAQKQLDSGIRTSVTGLINNVLELYIKDACNYV